MKRETFTSYSLIYLEINNGSKAHVTKLSSFINYEFRRGLTLIARDYELVQNKLVNVICSILFAEYCYSVR